MRALVLGLLFGLMVGALATLIITGQTIGLTGDAISTTGKTITLPASAALETIDADLIIVNGRVEPRSLTVDAGRDVEITVLAITGPGMITIPETGQSTPLLSNRQMHTLLVRIVEPGTYEVLCRPCGTEQSLESVRLIVI
jgi:hypothetical protein